MSAFPNGYGLGPILHPKPRRPYEASFERLRESSPKKRMPLAQGHPFLFFPYTYASFSLACEIKGIKKDAFKVGRTKKGCPWARGILFSGPQISTLQKGTCHRGNASRHQICGSQLCPSVRCPVCRTGCRSRRTSCCRES